MDIEKAFVLKYCRKSSAVLHIENTACGKEFTDEISSAARYQSALNAPLTAVYSDVLIVRSCGVSDASVVQEHHAKISVHNFRKRPS